jgi:hypothetical protein
MLRTLHELEFIASFRIWQIIFSSRCEGSKPGPLKP